jgi:hypothetical protein
MPRLSLLLGMVMCTLFGSPGCATDASLSEEDLAAAFAAAGFSEMDGEYVRCDDTVSVSRQPGRIEIMDLNEDSLPEVFVKEGSVICYGNTAEAFVLLTKEETGAWRVLLDQVGIPVVTETENMGWPDIEVGGPGFGAFPVFRFDGTQYTRLP